MIAPFSHESHFMNKTAKLLLAAAFAVSGLTTQAETLAEIDTNYGTIKLSLDEQRAPKTVANFVRYAEKGFYNNIIGTSTICSIFCDSIKLDKQKMTFTYYGRQRIERRTSILMRQLITAGSLRRISRSENNPHGFIIFGWRTLVNKDLSESQKTNF